MGIAAVALNTMVQPASSICGLTSKYALALSTLISKVAFVGILAAHIWLVEHHDKIRRPWDVHVPLCGQSYNNTVVLQSRL